MIRRPWQCALLPILMGTLSGCSWWSTCTWYSGGSHFNSDGAIQGRVCDAAGRDWLANAEVSTHIMVDERIVDTRVVYTDPTGAFFLEDLPSERSYDLVVQAEGAWWSTAEMSDVHVADGVWVELPDPPCLALAERRALVVEGSDDDLVQVFETLGLGEVVALDGTNPTTLVSVLTDPLALSQFDMVAVESGIAEAALWLPVTEDLDPDPLAQVLLDWVEAGGVFVATDRAYDLVERTWPAALDFMGDDTVAGAAEWGQDGAVDAQVVDTALAEVLDADGWALQLDQPDWAVITAASDAVSEHLRADVQEGNGETSALVAVAPVLVSFHKGTGTVIFGSFPFASNGGDELDATLRHLLRSSW